MSSKLRVCSNYLIFRAWVVLLNMYTLGAGKIFIKSIIIVCLLNLMAWKASWVHRTCENEEKKKIMIK